jgi:hypothetical protein
VRTLCAQRTEGLIENEVHGSVLEEEDMLNGIFTGDESWVHHYQPESKHASMQWKHPSSPPNKKFTVAPSAWKIILTVFRILREYC